MDPFMVGASRSITAMFISSDLRAIITIGRDRRRSGGGALGVKSIREDWRGLDGGGKRVR
jgi:hypothetical protein